MILSGLSCPGEAFDIEVRTHRTCQHNARHHHKLTAPVRHVWSAAGVFRLPVQKRGVIIGRAISPGVER